MANGFFAGLIVGFSLMFLSTALRDVLIEIKSFRKEEKEWKRKYEQKWKDGEQDDLNTIMNRFNQIGVHAHWEKSKVDVAEHPWHCSRCGGCPPNFVWHIEEMEYCNHCGAKMDESVGNSDKLKEGEE